MTWGVVATVKADTKAILQFAAYHLDAGAHRVFVYLDEDDEAARLALKAHPKCRVTRCTQGYWRKLTGKRPVKHQVRQTRNATRVYVRADVDWLAHIDVDEFLVADEPINARLAELPKHVQTVRARPMELLAGGNGTAFKAFVPPLVWRHSVVSRIYPTFGPQLRDGFMSHNSGKLFARTSMDEVEFRIHNVFRNGEKNPGEVELNKLRLAHRHATDWAHWMAAYRFRVTSGSYRSDLAAGHDGMNLHSVLTGIEATKGEAGLRRFFDEVCMDTPALRTRLEQAGLLQCTDLDLDEKTARHFPQI